MKTLECNFTKGKRKFELNKKSSTHYWYNVKLNYDDTTSECYEIFQHKVQKPWKYNDQETVRYPNDEDFGSWAWCFSQKTSAQAKWDALHQPKG